MSNKETLSRREFIACIPGIGAALGLADGEHEERIDCLEFENMVQGEVLKGHEYRLRKLEGKHFNPGRGESQGGDV